MREIINDMIRLRRALEEDKPRIANKIREKLDKLEGVADQDDHSAQQFLLAHRARLGQPEGPYNSDEKLAMQLEAIHLTCPKFDPEDFQHGRYTLRECTIINQIANTYSETGQRKKAIDLFRQLLWYVGKNCQELTGYANTFCLIAHNYAIALGIEEYYLESVEIADQGRKVCNYYGDYQFLPGFLAIQAESNYFLGKEIESRELYLQAYYIYKAFGDGLNLEHMRQEMKEHLDIDMPGLPKCQE